MSDHGRWIWYELITPEVEGAKRFYGSLLGWTAQDLPALPGAEPYSILENAGHGIGGIMRLGEAMQGMAPNWTGYVCVDDCDAAAAKIQTLGGALIRQPQDIPGVGRFAVVADPGGAVFVVMKPTPPEGGARPPPDRHAIGQCGWHELISADPVTNFGFYEAMFGWTQGEPLDMGPMGIYQLFGNQDGESGGMMRRPDQMPMAAWLFYFRVPDIDAAAAKVAELGGQVRMGPMQVPNGEWVIQAADPQGAVFAAVARKA